MPKILILRFSSIGDIVLTTPVIRCLKTQLPNAEIHFATKKNFKVLVENNPYIDKFHLLDTSDNQLIADLKKEKFDYVIDLHHNIRTLKIKLSLGVKSFSFDKLNIQKWLLVNLKINQMPKVHIVDRYMKTVEPLGVINDQKGLDYFIPAKDEVDLNLLPIQFQNGFIAYAIGGQHFTKKMPTERIIEICKNQTKPVILLGGKEDFEAGEQIKNAIGNTILNACGAYNLNQSASILGLSDLVITHDTGLMHIAAALKKRVISIWGNTVPEFGMYPYLIDYQIVENKDLSCRPCSKIGYKKCPKGHFKCMKEIDLQELR